MKDESIWTGLAILIGTPTAFALLLEFLISLGSPLLSGLVITLIFLYLVIF